MFALKPGHWFYYCVNDPGVFVAGYIREQSGPISQSAFGILETERELEVYAPRRLLINLNGKITNAYLNVKSKTEK